MQESSFILRNTTLWVVRSRGLYLRLVFLPDRNNLRREGLVWALSLRVQSVMMGQPGGGRLPWCSSLKQLVTPQLSWGSNDEYWCSSVCVCACVHACVHACACFGGLHEMGHVEATGQPWVLFILEELSTLVFNSASLSGTQGLASGPGCCATSPGDLHP